MKINRLNQVEYEQIICNTPVKVKVTSFSINKRNFDDVNVPNTLLNALKNIFENLESKETQSEKIKKAFSDRMNESFDAFMKEMDKIFEKRKHDRELREKYAKAHKKLSRSSDFKINVNFISKDDGNVVIKVISQTHAVSEVEKTGGKVTNVNSSITKCTKSLLFYYNKRLNMLHNKSDVYKELVKRTQKMSRKLAASGINIQENDMLKLDEKRFNYMLNNESEILKTNMLGSDGIINMLGNAFSFNSEGAGSVSSGMFLDVTVSGLGVTDGM